MKRRARSAGNRLKRGRPRTTPRVHKGDMRDLIEATSNGLCAVTGNTLYFFHQIQCNSVPRPVSIASGWQILSAAGSS